MRAAVKAPAAAPEERPFPEPIRLRLRRRVLALDYAGCSKLLTRLLEELGYEDVRPAGRTTLLGYNRPGGGGWDLTATLPAGVGSRRVVVRLKHSAREHSGPDPKPVHQRCADELRGACLRAGAAEGLMVSTGSFSLTARNLAAGNAAGVAPVRLVDGEELVELLLAQRVGVREARGLFGGGRLELDGGFFDGLAATPARPQPRRRRPDNIVPKNGTQIENGTEIGRRTTPWRVTVRLVAPGEDSVLGGRRDGRGR